MAAVPHVRDDIGKSGTGGGPLPAERLLPAGEVWQWDARPAVSEAADAAAPEKQSSAASMNRLARKMIAREWALAKGTMKTDQDRWVEQFKREAAEYQGQKETENREIAAARRRADTLKQALQRSFSVFGFALAELAPEARGAVAEELLSGALRPVGDVDHIHWRADGCDVTFEPWEERRARRGDRTSSPVLFQASVNDQLLLTGCARLEGDAYEQVRREAILDRIGAVLRQRGRTPEILQSALAQVGRVVDRFSSSRGIKIAVEPWEEVRRRNIERRGRPPISTYVISADAALENFRCEPSQSKHVS